MVLPLLVAVLALLVPVHSRSILLKQSIDQTADQSNDQTIDQSITQSINERLCPSPDAPYQLSKSPPMIFTSRYHTGSYILAPCQGILQSIGPPSHRTIDQTINQSIDQSINQAVKHCGSFVNQTMCYFYDSTIVGLGSVYSTSWAPVNGDYINGATSTNYDISQSNNQTISQSNDQSNNQSNNQFCDPSTSEVNVVYRCIKGTDLVTVITEPQYPTDNCVFIFEVDSSVICNAESNNQSNNPSVSQPIIWGAVGVAGLAILLISLACYIHRRKVNRSINQSNNQSINQSNDQSSLYSNLLTHQSNNQSINQSTPSQHIMSVPNAY